MSVVVCQSVAETYHITTNLTDSFDLPYCSPHMHVAENVFFSQFYYLLCDMCNHRSSR